MTPTGRHGHAAARRGVTVMRVAVAVVSVFLVAVSGVGWWTLKHTLGGITISEALGPDAPRSGDGAINLLLIGLDSRKDMNGNDLPQEVRPDELHAGIQESAATTPTPSSWLHIPTDDKVIAFSIPRDDYVAVNGISGYATSKSRRPTG